MLLSPIRHQPFPPQPQRVGNGGETLAEQLFMFMERQVQGQLRGSQITLAERWLKILLEEACKETSQVNYTNNTHTEIDWSAFLWSSLSLALKSVDNFSVLHHSILDLYNFNSLHPTILELDEKLAEKYGVEGVTSVLRHILNNPPPASSLDSFNKSPQTI
jgi:hypothetical protein